MLAPKPCPLALEWRDGPPPKPWADEWFIALTTYGDRVVLRSLPEEYTYDFKTADETYIKADRIAKWMQFPDSHYIAPRSPVEVDAMVERCRINIEAAHKWLSDGQQPRRTDTERSLCINKALAHLDIALTKEDASG